MTNLRGLDAKGKLTLNYFQFPVSFGTVLISWNEKGLLRRIELLDRPSNRGQTLMVPLDLAETINKLRNYFYSGTPLGAVPWKLLELEGLSPFQVQVYEMTCRVSHGDTRTYGWIAKGIGKRSASRAVGQALKKNPFPVLIPCHRIVGAHSMGGFMGEEDSTQPLVQMKRTLISLEEEYLNPVFAFLPAMMNHPEYSCLSTLPL